MGVNPREVANDATLAARLPRANIALPSWVFDLRGIFLLSLNLEQILTLAFVAPLMGSLALSIKKLEYPGSERLVEVAFKRY